MSYLPILEYDRIQFPWTYSEGQRLRWEVEGGGQREEEQKDSPRMLRFHQLQTWGPQTRLRAQDRLIYNLLLALWDANADGRNP